MNECVYMCAWYPVMNGCILDSTIGKAATEDERMIESFEKI